jgi:hypothetical protein
MNRRSSRPRRLLAGPIRHLMAGLVWIGAALIAGCEDEVPPGSGFVTLSVRGPVPLGAVVVELSGATVEAAEDPSGGWVALASDGPPTSTGPRYRLVVVLREPGSPQIRLRVPDVSGRLPVATLQQATSGDNAPVPSLGSIEVEIRP